MKRRTVVGLAYAVLVVLVLAFAGGCESDDRDDDDPPPEPRTKKFIWRGTIWFLNYDKSDGSVISVQTPWGTIIQPSQSTWPQEFRIIDDKLRLPPDAVFASAAQRSAEAFEPSTVYLLDVAGEDRILIGNAATAEYQGKIVLPTRPQRMALSRDRSRLYVSHLEDTVPSLAHPPRISVVDTEARAITRSIDLAAGTAPRDIVPSLEDKLLYVAQDSAGVLILDVAQGSVLATIALGRPGATVDRLAMTPDGERIYAVGTQVSPARLFAIDTLSREIVTSIVLSRPVRDMLLDHTGTRLYLSSDDTVLVVDTASTLEVARIPVGTNARINSLALSFDGDLLFANHELDGRVTRISTQTYRVVGDTVKPGGQSDSSYVLMVP